jgi:hypothetical protein
VYLGEQAEVYHKKGTKSNLAVSCKIRELMVYSPHPMNKNIILVSLGAVLLGVGIFLVARLLLGREAGPASLKITSTPQATIFLDTQHLGKTPYEDKVKSGEYTLKLIPESGTTAVSWQAKVKLIPGVLTYVNRELSDQELTSAGEILTLEKISGKSAEIAVLSTPDGAQVNLDGISKGSTPLVLQNIEIGDHEISVAAPGFLTRGVKIKTTPGFKLVASFQLALSSLPATPSATPTPGPTPTGTPKPTTSPRPTGTPSAELPRPYVKILDTPTGWLRVRIEPSTSATEAAKVNPGETYPLLGEQSGWYKIRYEGTKEGWISGQYAEKFD